ncbi:metal-dependent hydrolase [Salidesulfovibrio brasiliensis]|uniref:metal-dependent hydrolase n=1 Tax=Salidesulfovibrio brasiliensis TaxID=221711 RepID=UPI0006D032A6|nr:metal-dependent hydrolase [Salidesulfovibrio brasiliensis]
MPGYKGHLAGGTFVGGMAATGAVMFGLLHMNPLLIAALMGFCLMGALFPDTDTESKGQNLFYLIFAAVDLGLILKKYYIWAAWLGFLAMLPPIGSHRGWTHTWWAMLVVPLPIILIPAILFNPPDMMPFYQFYAAFTVGYFSHLLLDGEFR